MVDFTHILHWTLKRGSHPFPGPDGGTCINEAAIVAAGFPYQRVRRVGSMPACFSRPICDLAMQLNDAATDQQRQQLVPFVTRLACADVPEVEAERADFIAAWASGSKSFDERVRVLEAVLGIGRPAHEPMMDEVYDRLERIRGTSLRAVSRQGLFAKLATWPLGKAKVLEGA